MGAPHAQHLRIVTEAGEVVEEQCPNCAGAEKEVRAWRMRYANLKRQVEGDIDHDLFPAAARLFDYWKFVCRHLYHTPPKVAGRCPACKRTQFSAERFKQIEARLTEHGEELCHKAIEGAAYDPYTVRRKNGTYRRHNDWEQIFDRGPDKFMDFCNRAPYHLADPKHCITLARALMFLNPEWESDYAVDEASRRLRDDSDARTRIGDHRRKELIRMAR